MGFFGKSVSSERLREIRDMPPKGRSDAIWTLLIENGGSSASLWSANQRSAAYRMLEALVDFRRTGISGLEVKSIIKMSKDCW